jgi:hypothetical protein
LYYKGYEKKHKLKGEGKMRKVWILVVILTAVGLSNAGMILTANGQADDEIWMRPSDAVWLGVATNQIGVPLIITVYIGIADLGEGEWTGASRNFLQPDSVWLSGWDRYFDENIGDIWFYSIGDIPDPSPIPAAGLLGEVLFHCKAPGDVTIRLTDEMLNPLDSLIIHQMPEPATMALLALGGLLMRRK